MGSVRRVTKDPGSSEQWTGVWARRVFAASIVSVGCLTPVALGRLERDTPPTDEPQRAAQAVPPSASFVFDPADARHANLGLPPPERPEPLDAAAAIDRTAPEAPKPKRSSIPRPMTAATINSR